jgi:FkbM family methyltransferase
MGGIQMLIDNFLSFINLHGGINPEIILDVGSRDLDQSIEFSKAFPNSIIHAFEPNPNQFDMCVKKSKTHSNIFVHQFAVGDAKSNLDFYLTLGNIGASSLLKPIDVPFASTQEYEKISVDCVRLDEWLLENNIKYVDILWMDTQGVELLALKGMGSFLKNVKFIHCEASVSPYYEGHILKKDLEQFLIQNNFKIEFIPCLHPYGEGDILAVNNSYVKNIS